MRSTSFILSILILILSCLPCADVDCMTIVQPNIQKAENNASREQHENHGNVDLCSPFCHCTCCATYTVINNVVSIPERIDVAVCPIFTVYLSADLIEISLPVWQPPQLI